MGLDMGWDVLSVVLRIFNIIIKFSILAPESRKQSFNQTPIEQTDQQFTA
jgi:hypothetical protein